MCKNHHLCHEKLSHLGGKSVFQPSYHLFLIVRLIAGSLISCSRSLAIKMASAWGLTNRLQKADPRVKYHQPFALFSCSQTNTLDVSVCGSGKNMLSSGRESHCSLIKGLLTLLQWAFVFLRHFLFKPLLNECACVLYCWMRGVGDILNIYNVFQIILLRIQNVHCDFATMHFLFAHYIS